ncbi:hypothetical protein K1719_004816 [Acacia pycnantha]|nr:hypothetical protein K1719_004816 [Acacia pycnantha]
MSLSLITHAVTSSLSTFELGQPKMEGNAWLQVMASLCYCFLIGKLVPPSGSFLRLLLLLPIVCFFLYLPLNLHSLRLIGIFSFFIAWLANFKLLLFAFNKGPLSHPSLSPPMLHRSCFSSH